MFSLVQDVVFRASASEAAIPASAIDLVSFIEPPYVFTITENSGYYQYFVSMARYAFEVCQDWAFQKITFPNGENFSIFKIDNKSENPARRFGTASQVLHSLTLGLVRHIFSQAYSLR